MNDLMVSFLVINWNGGEMLAECLDSIGNQRYENYEVIVVDNGSVDGSWDLPHFLRPGWHLKRLVSNTGFSEANNLAYQQSQGELVALINNDVTLAPDWTGLMVSAFSNDSKAGSAACRILQHDCPSKLDSAGFSWYASGTVTAWVGRNAEYFSGRSHHPFGAVASAALYRRNALEKVGLFRPPFFAYYEDTDLAARMTLFAFTCLYVNEAVACHRGSVTGGRSRSFKEYHLRRNIEYLYWTNMVGSLAIRYFFIHMLYEVAVFIKMLASGRATVFIRAKRDAFGNRHWIAAERKALRDKLMCEGEFCQARQRLSRNLTPWWNWLVGRGGRRLWRS